MSPNPPPPFPRNSPCPCGSGKKFKHCHGSENPADRPATHARSPQDPGGEGLENPFRKIFNEDGSVDGPYVLSRLRHLEAIMQKEPTLLGVRYDRDRLEELLAERHDLFSKPRESTDEFEELFREFASFALPELVTKEFDEQAKEALRSALQDRALTPRDRAAAACGLVLTLPTEGDEVQPHHENPFFDLVLRVTYNESVARAEFLAGLEKEGEMSDVEREARIQEFFRSVPALLHELQAGFQKRLRKALSAWERGDYSFGIGLDMILHGLRAVRRMTQEYEDEEGDAFTDRQKQEFADRFGKAISDSFAEDFGEEEEAEVFARMVGFLEDAKESGERQAARGLAAALDIMEQNPEIRHRMLLAAYHEACTGKRIYRSPAEGETAIDLLREPFDLERYTAYGEALAAVGEKARAERVYRSALEFFPEDEALRNRLEELGLELEPGRIEAAMRAHEGTFTDEEDEEGEAE
jgi:hypothetical protein